MANIDVEAFKKAGFTYEQIQNIIVSEEEFERTGVGYSHEEVKIFARKELFSNNKKIHV